MPDAYEVYDSRYVQLHKSTSAAGALSILTLSGVPEGKVWTIVGANYAPSVAETKIVCYGIYTKNGDVYPVTIPQSFAYVTTLGGLGFPLVREGMELKLYPGDYLFAARDSATAGSTMSLSVRVIESDLPPYRYIDPQSQVVRRAVAHSTNLRSSSPGSVSRGGIDVGEGGGGHRSEPK